LVAAFELEAEPGSRAATNVPPAASTAIAKQDARVLLIARLKTA
jgi:hypothetical protein